MNTSSTDRIHKEITLRAPVSRVWRAISDHEEFGTWFQVKLEGPIRAGAEIRGPITHEGCDRMVLRAQVEKVEPERYLSLRWCPYAHDPDEDYSAHPTTLVEFTLEPAGDGTKLTITESGFDALPEDLRHESFVRNEGGWTAQVENVRKHVDG